MKHAQHIWIHTHTHKGQPYNTLGDSGYNSLDQLTFTMLYLIYRGYKCHRSLTTS